jgi:hypothetical protein
MNMTGMWRLAAALVGIGGVLFAAGNLMHPLEHSTAAQSPPRPLPALRPRRAAAARRVRRNPRHERSAVGRMDIVGMGPESVLSRDTSMAMTQIRAG